MKFEIEADTVMFSGLMVQVEPLTEALHDPNHFYRFSNDGDVVTIERYEFTSLEGIVKP